MVDHSTTVEERVILFWDIHNFSIAANRLGDKMYGLLQEVYERLGDTIVAYEGEIIKYMGDAMLCLFPAGSENEAIACAIELRKAYSDLVSRANLSQDTELEIGIASGKVTVGIFGHKSLRQKDVFGEEVNRAAMIGHHRGIAITENVYKHIQEKHKTRRLPDFEVKWRDQPLKIWEIVE
jgi:class 3 adenylate cyclase